MLHASAAVLSPRCLLEINNLRSCPIASESESACKPDPQVMPRHVKVWETWSAESNKTQPWPSLQLHALLPSLTQFQPHWTPHCSFNMASTLSRKDICSYSSLCLECSAFCVSTCFIPSAPSDTCSVILGSLSLTNPTLPSKRQCFLYS